MIVADCNVLAYLVIPGARTPIAKQAFARDGNWAAPALRRSEFLSVLATYLRVGAFDLAAAEKFMRLAEQIMTVLPPVSTVEVLSCTARSRCSSYDCEYAAAAQVHAVSLVTEDQKLLAAFPMAALSLDQFVKTTPPK